MKVRRILLGALAVVVAAQLVPVDRTNPPSGAEVPASPQVSAILHRSCWDCHSNETVWGWHTYVAPISWLAVHDVNEARRELNFSRWETVGADRLEKLRRKIAEEVGEGEMPMRIYVLAHPSARLSDAERRVIVEWGRTVGLASAAAPIDAAVLEPAGHDEDGGHHRRGRDER